MPRLGVLGWPVAHSRSPAMHNAAFAAAGLAGWRYQRLPVPPECFEETVRALGPAGFMGANVTIPHKEAALRLADRASPSARAIGAANTLTFAPDGGIEADNTDAPGFLGALPLAPAGATAMVLGAGGSARAVVWALRDAGAEKVWVWNRTAERAEALARELDAVAVGRPVAADLLVNCTAVGLEDSATLDTSLKQLEVSNDDLTEYRFLVDLVYREDETPLLKEARRQGAVTVDGLEVLVRQGALSFERWTGRLAPLEAMRVAASAAGTEAEGQIGSGHVSEARSSPRTGGAGP